MGFELSRIGDISQTSTQRIPDGATKLNEHSPNKFSYVSEFSKASRMRIGGCVMFDKCTEKLKGNRGV